MLIIVLTTGQRVVNTTTPSTFCPSDFPPIENIAWLYLYAPQKDDKYIIIIMPQTLIFFTIIQFIGLYKEPTFKLHGFFDKK